MAPFDLVPETAQDRLHVAIPSSPIGRDRDEEARGLENDLYGSTLVGHDSPMAEHESRLNSQRSTNIRSRFCSEPLGSFQHHSLHTLAPSSLGYRSLKLGAQPQGETSS